MELAATLGVIVSAIVGVACLALLIATFFMWLGAKIVGVEKATFLRSFLAAFGSAFLTWFLSLVLVFLPPGGPVIGFFVGLVLVVFVIKGAYDTDFGKALLVWIFHLLAEIAAIVIGFLTFAGVLMRLV